MAIQQEDGSFSGLVGTVVIYKANGKNIMRARPRKGNRKARKENIEFGLVSRHGSAMMRALKGYFLFPVNKEVFNYSRGWMSRQYKLHNEAASWPLAIRPSQCTRLHAEADLRDFFAGNVQVSDQGNGKLVFTLPALDPVQEINCPAGVVSLNMKVITVTAPFTGGIHEAEPVPVLLEHTIPYKPGLKPAMSFDIQTAGKAGDMALLILALECKVRGKDTPFLMEKKWLPANMIGMGRLG